MNQSEIKVILLSLNEDTDVLRFCVDPVIDVNLNSAECQNALKCVFAALLKLAIDTDIILVLEIDPEFKRTMYKEVCQQYIEDLNRELSEIIDQLRRELT